MIEVESCVMKELPDKVSMPDLGILYHCYIQKVRRLEILDPDDDSLGERHVV